MKARQLVLGASYEPEALQVICRAFEGAWAEIASRETPRPSSIVIEAARLKPANIVLSLAVDDTNDVEALKSRALLTFVAGE